MESGVAPGGGGLSLHLPFGWFQAGKMEHTHLKDKLFASDDFGVIFHL